MPGDHKKPAIVLLALIALVAVAGAVWWTLSQPKTGPYGAIAMSDSNLAYGGAWGYRDPIDAYRRSIAECNKAGNTDCVVKVSLKNNCAALAISADHNASYLVSGGDQVQATQTAMNQCTATGATDCAIRENICSSAS